MDRETEMDRERDRETEAEREREKREMDRALNHPHTPGRPATSIAHLLHIHDLKVILSQR
jgi:hypothetical protein